MNNNLSLAPDSNIVKCYCTAGRGTEIFVMKELKDKGCTEVCINLI